MANVLIIDDDVQLCRAVALVVEHMGHAATCAFTLADGLKQVEDKYFETVILDIMLPDGNGLEAIARIKGSRAAPEVIILSGAGDPDGAELAIRNGAWNYITKPPTLNKIQLPVQRAIEYHAKKRNSSQSTVLKRCGILGESPALTRCLELVAQAAGTEANVLVSGETGTGKELFARAIHENSARASGPFVIVDCAALPDAIVESVLFGHEKGAFTGADRRTEGLILQAHGGTLFLDEIGELPLAVQKSFLRVLQNRTFRPVGGLTEVTSNFRLVAATNKNLDAEVERWTFRQDLLFRLRTLCLELPPLRARAADIPLLASHFVQEFCARAGCRSPKRLTGEFLEVLQQYGWPGNVRELANAMESAVAAAGREQQLQPRHLPLDIRVHQARSLLTDQVRSPQDKPPAALDSAALPRLKEYRKKAVEELERYYLQQLLARTDGDMKKACRISGMSRARIYALLKQHGLKTAALD